MSILLHKDDAWIDRQVIGRPDITQLRDNDGCVYYNFPKEWTDIMIIESLAFANKAYNLGVEAGRREKAREIRDALDEGKPNA